MNSRGGIEKFRETQKKKRRPWALRFEGKTCSSFGRLTLGELEALAGAGLAGLLAFFLAGVTGQVTGLLEGDAELGIELQQGAVDAVAHGAGLGADATAGDVHDDVEFFPAVSGDERGDGALHEVVVGEIG